MNYGWAVCLGMLVVPMIGHAGERTLTSQERSGIEVWEAGYTGYKMSGAFRDTVTHTWQVRFKNETPLELASMTVQVRDVEDGHVAWKSLPVTLKHFVNISVPHAGSILPWNKTEFVGGIDISMPSRRWNTHSDLQMRLLKVTTFTNPDLHDAGHLYTFMVNSIGAETIAQFKKDPSLMKVRNSYGVTPTLMAFGGAETNAIRYLLAHGGSIKEKAHGFTAMHFAAISLRPGALDLALQRGCDVNALSIRGRSPLDKAIVHGAPVAWRWLLAHGAKSHNIDSEWSTARYAIVEGQNIALDDLVGAGANPHIKDVYGNGWMHYAVDNCVMMDQVLRFHVPIDDPNRKGFTPLMLSARTGAREPAIWLLQHGADPNRKDKLGFTAFDYSRQGNTLKSERFFRALVEQYGRSRHALR